MAESSPFRVLLNDFRRVVRDEAVGPKCPTCGHWLKWRPRLQVWKCSWCGVQTDDPPADTTEEEK